VTSSAQAIATVDTAASGGTRPVVKISFAVLAALLVSGLVGLKTLEYLSYLDFSIEAVMDPRPMSRAAPAFSLPRGPSGGTLASEASRGKYVLVHFWATWCPPCRDELRSLEYLTRRLGDRVQVLAVTVDDDWSEVNRFFGAQPPTFELLWDRERQTAQTYGTEKFPETYLVDPQGQLIAKFIGARDWNSDAARRYFDRLLGG